MSFTYSGYTALDLEVQRLLGRPGVGFYRLGFSTKLKLPSTKIDSVPPKVYPVAAVSEISAEIHVRGNRTADLFAGIARPESPQTIALESSAYESQVLFYLELDRARVEALEELRHGGDLWLRPIWRCVVHGANGPQPSESSSGIEFHANQSTWLTVLREMGYRASLLFEIPIPTETSGPLREAVRLLHAAEDDYRANRIDDALSDCRKALEELATTLDQTELEKAKHLYSRGTRDDGQPNRKDMTVEQRFLMACETLRNVTHLAAHPRPPGPGYDYARRDAAAVIALTAVLLSRMLVP